MSNLDSIVPHRAERKHRLEPKGWYERDGVREADVSDGAQVCGTHTEYV